MKAQKYQEVVPEVNSCRLLNFATCTTLIDNMLPSFCATRMTIAMSCLIDLPDSDMSV